MKITDEKTLRAAMDEAWVCYTEKEKQNAKRIAETTTIGINEKRGKQVYSMTFGEATMKYTMEIVGEPGENGYPVYICLHGGGGSDTPDINNQQWEHMMIYYRDAVENGIYIAPRGVRDTYDCHSNPESYPLYDELISNLILFENADPNRVYLLGFSAGGDGVYQISIKMSDRFAAVNMSAGHPNGIQVNNLCNLPMILQCGENDAAYGRNKVTAEYGIKLNELQANTDAEHYIHTLYIHKDKPHNYMDHGFEDQKVLANPEAWYTDGDESVKMVDANAVRLVSEYTRKPLPNKVEWNLGTRAGMRETESFYWLSADRNLNHGIIHAEYNKEENMVFVFPEEVNGDFRIYISPDMLNLFAPIEFITPEGRAIMVLKPDNDTIANTIAERGDKAFCFAASVSYSDILDRIEE